MTGRAWKFGNNIDTDAIIPGRYLVINDPEELAKHLFESIQPDMATHVNQGDFVAAGENFGCGSSREHAPLALKGAGISAVIAESFARIFFRNSINIGLPLFICREIIRISDGDLLDIDMRDGIIHNLTKDDSYKTTPLPPFLMNIIESGGLVEYTKKLLSKNAMTL